MRTRIYVDTEFSDFSSDSELISIGALSVTGEDFYAELNPAPTETSEFVKEHVLPLLEGDRCECERHKFPVVFADWLSQFSGPLLVSDSSWDIFHVRKSFGMPAHHNFGEIKLATSTDRVIEVGLVTLPPMGDSALEIFYAALANYFRGDPRQHHALVDARALAFAFERVEAGVSLVQP